MSNSEAVEDEQFHVSFTFSLVKEDGTPAAGRKMFARCSSGYGDQTVETADADGNVTFGLWGTKGSEWSRFEGGRHELRVMIVLGARYDMLNEHEHWLGDGDGCHMTVPNEGN